MDGNMNISIKDQAAALSWLNQITLLNEEYHAEMQDAGRTLQQTKEFAEGTVVDELVNLGSSSLDAAQKTFEAIDAIAQTVEKVCSIVGGWQEGIIGKIGGAISSLYGR